MAGINSTHMYTLSTSKPHPYFSYIMEEILHLLEQEKEYRETDYNTCFPVIHLHNHILLKNILTKA